MMWIFLLFAAILLAATLAFVLTPLLRKRGDGERRAAGSVLGLAMIMTAAAGGLYAWVGTPEGIRDTRPAATPGNMQQAISRLEERLNQQPGDLEGWLLLGRSRMAVGDAGGAVQAYRRAREIAPNEPVILVALAEALAQAGGHDLAGEPRALLEQAVRQDPLNQRALWFAGIAAWQEGDYETAAQRWEKLLGLLEPGSEVATSVREQLAAARQQAGMAPPEPASEPSPEPATMSPGTVGVDVSIADSLKDRVGMGNIVFVFARPSSGPAMPLAVKRFPASELPTTLTLGPDDAMTPQNALKPGMEVVVTARISKTGSATPQAGDLQGATEPFTVGDRTDLSITIDRELGAE